MTTLGSQNGRTAPSNPDDLRREIAQTRTDLGQTVEALAAKADVKGRAQESVEHAKLRVRESVAEAKVAATRAARELRADPVGQLRLATAKTRRSIRRNPTPWTVAVGLVALATVIGYQRRRR